MFLTRCSSTASLHLHALLVTSTDWDDKSAIDTLWPKTRLKGTCPLINVLNAGTLCARVCFRDCLQLLLQRIALLAFHLYHAV